MPGDHGSKQQQLRQHLQQLLQQLRGLGRRPMALVVFFIIFVLACSNVLIMVQSAHPNTPAAALPSLKHSMQLDLLTHSCSDHAAGKAVSIADVGVLAPKSRDLPKTDAAAPVLVASNWEGAANRSHAGAHQPSCCTSKREPCCCLQTALCDKRTVLFIS
jgi:hypothetical protein